MSFIKITERSAKSKQKKKPGWQQREAEHAAWLAKVNSMTFSSRAPRIVKKVVDPVVKQPTVRKQDHVPSLSTPGGSTGRVVNSPEILYADNAELLERERAARARKFNVAPAYNKGADQLVTEEELAATLRTNKRR